MEGLQVLHISTHIPCIAAVVDTTYRPYVLFLFFIVDFIHVKEMLYNVGLATASFGNNCTENSTKQTPLDFKTDSEFHKRTERPLPNFNSNKMKKNNWNDQ